MPLAFTCSFLLLALPAQQPGPAYEPHLDPLPARIVGESSEGEDAIATFQVPEDLSVSLFAAEPLVANPVAFDIDPKGRIYVAETFRQETGGVPDNRAFPEWLEDDLQLRTVEERAAMMLRHHPEKHAEWTSHEDRISLLSDTDGDGVADRSVRFATGFSGLLDGTGAGVLAVEDDVYFTCIPKLWRLRDVDGDGTADEGESLHHGFGVRVAFRGHDMHGLILGPDRRLYWSIGDRGYHVLTAEGVMLADPGRGAIFRSNLDGSDLEVFAVGLRNPQELAFDDYGNLFTVDNNCDAGDQARLIHLVEGSDSGWSMNFQYLPDRGPWMSESWWKPAAEVPGQPTFLHAPAGNITAGPSGLACYPGVGLGEGMEGSFFVSDFRGGASYSGVMRFTTRSQGATFLLDQQEEYWWGVLTTDVAFGPDGSLYLSDWVNGWIGEGKGRIYRAQSSAADAEACADSAHLLASDPSAWGRGELLSRLRHPDRRVRFQAQWEIVDRGGVTPLAIMATSPLKEGDRLGELSRLHVAWGLGMMLDQPKAVEALWSMLENPSPRVREAALQALRGQVGRNADTPERQAVLLGLLRDADLQVRRRAILAASEIQAPGTGIRLLKAFDRVSDGDRTILQAVALGLANALPERTLRTFSGNPDPQHRMAAVLALRHQESVELQRFLEDADPVVASEAAIAIYDRRIHRAMPALADCLLQERSLPRPMLRRALAAANRLGGESHAAMLLARAAGESLDADLLEEVRGYITRWDEPETFDRILNEAQSFPQRSTGWFADKELDFPDPEELSAIERGRQVFAENAEVGCTRCHSLDGVTPKGVLNPAGPDLSSVGNQLSREQLRESIVDPAATISEGFEIRDEAGNTLPISVMPATFGSQLTEEEIEDLCAFLEAQTAHKRILVHIDSQGYEHAVCRADESGLSLVERNMSAWAEADPRYEVVVDRGYERFTPQGLAEFDAVFFYTTGELPMTAEQKQALLDFVRSGGVFAGAHCAADTFYEWPEYLKMIGAAFDLHPWHQEVRLRIEDPIHPCNRHMTDGMTIHDEIYQFRDPFDRKRLQVLVSLDTESVDLTVPAVKRTDGDFALTWERAEGEGAVFYTALGHRAEVWNSDWFRRHLMEGILAVCQQQPKQPALADYRVDLGEGVELHMVPVPSPSGDALWMSTTEITWDQYDRFFLRPETDAAVDGITGPSLSVFPVTRGYGHDGYPALGMTQNAAERFCEWLNGRQSRTFRLPTEAEWKLAAGAAPAVEELDGVAWHAGNADRSTQPVGTREANAFGLYDMYGNVAEWVAGPTPKGRVLGGSFLDSAEDVAADRHADYEPSWQVRDPQWPKSTWWLSDGGFTGLRVVSPDGP